MQKALGRNSMILSFWKLQVRPCGIVVRNCRKWDQVQAVESQTLKGPMESCTHCGFYYYLQRRAMARVWTEAWHHNPTCVLLEELFWLWGCDEMVGTRADHRRWQEVPCSNPGEALGELRPRQEKDRCWEAFLESCGSKVSSPSSLVECSMWGKEKKESRMNLRFWPGQLEGWSHHWQRWGSLQGSTFWKQSRSWIC